MTTLLQPLMLFEEWVLEGLHSVGLTWGLAIVALTLLVRLALLPLAMRQASAGRRRAEHAPQLKALRERHAEDLTTMRAELAAIESGTDRHGGAIAGIVLQILVVWSLALLLRSDAADGTFGDASWLFIPDLSEPASGGVLALLLGGWLAVSSLRWVWPRGSAAPGVDHPVRTSAAAARRGAHPRRVLVYLRVGGVRPGQKVALRARGRCRRWPPRRPEAAVRERSVALTA